MAIEVKMTKGESGNWAIKIPQRPLFKWAGKTNSKGAEVVKFEKMATGQLKLHKSHSSNKIFTKITRHTKKYYEKQKKTVTKNRKNMTRKKLEITS